MTLIRTPAGIVDTKTTGAAAWLYKLLDRPLLGRTVKLGPEDVVNIGIADACRAWSLEGRLRAVWTHIPHEVGGGTKNAGLRYSVAKALGLITGSGDLVFTWSDGSGWIEVKRPKGITRTGKPAAAGTLTPEQKWFRDWCQRCGVRHAVVTSTEEATAVLVEWGCLT